MTTPAIYGDLVKVMRSVGHVGKDGFNGHAKFNFRGIDGVLNAVGPALREHGVVVIPNLINATYEEVQTSGGKKSTACRVDVEYVFASSQDGSTVTAKVAAESWDTGDKAMPKAMSVAFRTALIQALALPTDEPDPDSFTYTRAAAEEHRADISNRIQYANSGEDLNKLWMEAQKAKVLDDGLRALMTKRGTEIQAEDKKGQPEGVTEGA